MTALEDLLRESLREWSALPRPADDLAGVAIHAARRLRRRQFTVATAAAVLVVLAIIGGIAAAGGPHRAPVAPATLAPDPGPTAATPLDRYGIDVDVLVGKSLLITRDGHTHQLDTDAVTYLVRVPAGWLYGSGQTLTLLRTDGTTIPLAGIDLGTIADQVSPGPAVSADGQHLAWVSGDILHTANLTHDGLIGMTASPAPAGAFAQTWIGSRVVVGQFYGTGCCGYRPTQYDVWDPANGNFVPHWTKGLAPVYGPVPDGVPAFAMVRKDSTGTTTDGCLARVNGVTDMSVTASACLPGLTYQSLLGRLSPDGRYLTELDSGHLVVIDLSTVIRTGAPIGTCPTDSPATWESSHSVVGVDGAHGVIQRCTISGTTIRPATPDRNRTGLVDVRPVDSFGV